jgi:hypothetical protein
MNGISKDNRAVVWLGLATFAWSMLFVWQGLDFSDMGFWLTGYQQFYTNSDTIISSCWLSYFIGHWIGLALGGGVLAYKLGYVVIITMSAIIAYQLLASQLGRSYMLAAMVLLTVFFNRIYCGNWIAYYELTALFFLSGVALLFFGLVGNRKLLVVLAGVVLGANVFIRFPNLLGITLVSAIWVQAWAHRWSLRDVFLESSWFLGGFALGVALVWGLIVLNGHGAIFFQGMQNLFDSVGDNDSGYAVSGLFKRFIWDHFLAFAKALSIVLIWGWIAKWVSKKNFVVASPVILFSSILLFYDIYVRNQWQWCVPGICYVVLLSIIFLELRKDPPLALLAFIAGMVLLITSAGSNDGISLSIYGTWLALPLTLKWLWRGSDLTFSLHFQVSNDGFESNRKFSFEARSFRVFAICIVLALLFQSLASAWRYTFRDSTNRFAMTHTIAHPLLAGTFTTAERSKVVTELLDAMSHFTKPGDEVLAYNTITTVHFLTKTHPWLENPWPDITPPKKIAALILQKEKSGARLPCIVRATGSTWDNSWPIDAKPPTWGNLIRKPPRIFAEFVQRHGYVVSWSNEFFEILTTAQSLK